MVDVASARTTDTCSVCGSRFETGSAIMGHCEQGHEMDQDWNTARNLFAGEAEEAVL